MPQPLCRSKSTGSILSSSASRRALLPPCFCCWGCFAWQSAIPGSFNARRQHDSETGSILAQPILEDTRCHRLCARLSFSCLLDGRHIVQVLSRYFCSAAKSHSSASRFHLL